MNCGKRRIVRVKSLVDSTQFLVPIGDIHLGNKACAVDRLQETVEWIAEHPNALWIGMGDYADFIGYKDSRFDPTIVPKAITVADLGQLGHALMKEIAGYLRPIASQCVGLLWGNHEDAYQLKQTAQHLHAELCNQLGVQNLGYSCFQEIVYVCRSHRQRYLIRAHHGSGWAQTAGAVLNRLVRFMLQSEADITLVGHLHRRLTHVVVELGLERGCITEKVRMGAMTGTYLKTYAQDVTTYAEKKGYEPTALGSYKILLEPFGSPRIISDAIT